MPRVFEAEERRRKEFDGSNRQAKTFLGLMFLFYVFAILLIAKANTAG